MSQILQVPPIARGYHYPLQVRIDCTDTPFAPGATIVAQLRDYANGPLAGQLSTVDGSLFLDDDHTIELQVPAAVTARLGNSTALVDFVRTDVDDAEWLGVQLRLPVLAPATVLGTTPIGGSGASPGNATSAIVVSPPGWTLRLARCAARSSSVAPAPVLTTATVLGTASVTAAGVAGLAPLAAQLDELNASSLAHFTHMGA